MCAQFALGGTRTEKVWLFDFNKSVNGLIDGHLGKDTLAEATFNFDFTDGALKCGMGVKQLEVKSGDTLYAPTLPDGIIPQKVFYFKRYDEAGSFCDDRILVMDSEKELYEWKYSSPSAAMEKIEGIKFTSVPFAENYRLNGEDVILFSDGATLYVYDGASISKYDAPEITSMCVHNERLFVTTGGSETELWFSKTFDPTNWNLSLEEGGFIDFREPAGGLIKVLSFKGYLYAFAGYGIYRITAYNNQLEMYAERIFVNSGRIAENSVTECGRYIVYLAEDGFYRFDGTYSYRIMPELDKYLAGTDFKDIVTVYHNGRFYASLDLYIGKKAQKAVVVYDLYTKEFYIAKGINACDFTKLTADGFSHLMILCDDYHKIGELSSDGCIFGKPLEKLWRSHMNDYGICGEKTFAYLSLYTKTPITVRIESNFGSKELYFEGSPYRRKKRVGLKGDGFTVTITSALKNAEVAAAIIELEYR